VVEQRGERARDQSGLGGLVVEPDRCVERPSLRPGERRDVAVRPRPDELGEPGPGEPLLDRGRRNAGEGATAQLAERHVE